ncbi:hypothetical protein ACOSQ3_011998 [Xanthoceras sorbifolium]
MLQWQPLSRLVLRKLRIIITEEVEVIQTTTEADFVVEVADVMEEEVDLDFFVNYVAKVVMLLQLVTIDLIKISKELINNNSSIFSSSKEHLIKVFFRHI